MTKEEKEVNGDRVPEGFVESVNVFYESSDIMFKCFEDIYSEYTRGNDVRESLKGVRMTKPVI